MGLNLSHFFKLAMDIDHNNYGLYNPWYLGKIGKFCQLPIYLSDFSVLFAGIDNFFAYVYKHN